MAVWKSRTTRSTGNRGGHCSIDGIWRYVADSQINQGLVPIRVSPEVEEAGLDIEEHAERAYL